jgi:hypothetical protein
MHRIFLITTSAVMLSACADELSDTGSHIDRAAFTRAAASCDAMLASSHTQVEVATCTNDAVDRIIMPHAGDNADLVNLVKAYRLKLAELVDQGKLSKTDAKIEWAKVAPQVTSIEQAREIAREQANVQAAQAAAQQYSALRDALSALH